MPWAAFAGAPPSGYGGPSPLVPPVQPHSEVDTVPTLPGERARPVPGWPGYHVTSFGRVWSAKTRRFLRTSVSRTGYLTVCLSHRGRRRTITVHTLVARAYLGPKPPGTEVNHVDGDRLNNGSDNLEYVTRSANVRHAFGLGLYRRDGAHNPRARLTPAQVLEIRQLWAAGDLTQAEIARRYGVGSNTVRDIIHYRTWRSVGPADGVSQLERTGQRTAA